MSTDLTPVKERRYQACVAQIQTGIRSAFDTGAALAEVRDDKLYLGRFKTFKEFCKSMFNISRQYAYRLIAAADMKDEMSPIGDIKTESHARELAKVPPEDRASVLDQASSSGPPTAKAIANAAHQQIKEKETKAEPVYDATGLVIPAFLIPLWNRSGEVHKLMTAVSKAKTALEHAQEEDDPLFRPITVVGPDGQSETWSGLIAALTNSYRALKLAIPHAVCPACSGRIKNCTTCWGRGFVSEHFWKVQTAKETRAIRANVVKQQEAAR